MRKQKLIPSGCSSFSKQTVASAQNRFAYASDSHVYIYDEQSYCLEKIIPYCQESVTHIQFNPKNSNVIACVTKVPQLELWDITKGSRVAQISLESEVSYMDWNTQDTNLIILVFSNNLLTDELRVLNLQTQKFQQVVPSYSEVSIGKWHPRSPNKFVAGCKDGTIYFCNVDGKKITKSEKNHEVTIEDICWSLSEFLFLVVYSDGSMRLYEFEVSEPQIIFERTSTGISSVSWLDTMSGDFLTATTKVGALRLWNAAHETSKDMLKIGPQGILTITPSISKQGHFLLQLKSGEVVLYNALKRKIMFQTDTAHSDQVQKVKFNKVNHKHMASVGFDGSLRVWDTETMQMLAIFEDKQSKILEDQRINAVAWQPFANGPSELILAIGTGAGIVKLVDVKKNKMIQKLEICKGKQIFDLDWSIYGLLVGGEDKRVSFYKYEMGQLESVTSMVLSDCVRSVSWNPVKINLAIVGLFNGKAVIIDVDKYTVQQELSIGNGIKILSILWHPNFEYIFATGGSDGSVKVWDIKNNGHKNLIFHKAGTRSLVWNYEIPWMLISGGDDQRIAVWDIRENKLIYELSEPSISVSSLTTHPQKPFTVVSSHFDNSLIFWDLLGFKDIFQVEMKFLIDLGLLDVTSDPHDQMTTNVSGKISGAVGREMFSTLKHADPQERYSTILSFFNTQEGNLEFQNMISIMMGKGPLKDSEACKVLHISDSAAAFQSRAQELQQVSGLRMLGTALSKKEDRFKEAANLMLKAGNFQEYCELQMQLGNFEAAIATAPKVSLKYWQACINQYLEYLENYEHQQVADDKRLLDPEEERINYLLLLNRTQEAATLLHHRGEIQDAKLVKTLTLTGDFIPNPLQNHESVNVGHQNFESVEDLDYRVKDLDHFASIQAQKKFDQHLPIVAASIHLSLSDPKKALQKLILSNNLEYAYVVAQLFDKSCQDYILTLLFKKCIQQEALQIAFKILQQINNAQLRSVLEASFEMTEEENDEEEKQLSPHNNPKSQGQADDITKLLINKDILASVNLALAMLQQCDNRGVISQQTLTAFYLLGQFDLVQLSQEVFKQIISCYLAIAILKALYFQQFDMLRILAKLSQNPANRVHSQLLTYATYNNQQLLQLVTGEADDFLKNSFMELKAFLHQYVPMFEETTHYRHIYVNSSAKIEKEAFQNMYSELTGALILSKPPYQLEELQKAVNREEALDLAMLMPFSPMSLTFRRRIIPY